MLADLIQLMQTDFNNIYRQVFKRAVTVRWTELMTLTFTLTMGHFRLESVSMTGSLRYARPPKFTQRQLGTFIVEMGCGASNKTTKEINEQEEVSNLAPIPQLQVGPTFKIYLAMDTAEEMKGEDAPCTDDNRPLCMSYHLKGVCSLNCDRQHAYSRLSSHEHILLAAWKA